MLRGRPVAARPSEASDDPAPTSVSCPPAAGLPGGAASGAGGVPPPDPVRPAPLALAGWAAARVLLPGRHLDGGRGRRDGAATDDPRGARPASLLVSRRPMDRLLVPPGGELRRLGGRRRGRTPEAAHSAF